MKKRFAEILRETKETKVSVRLAIDGKGDSAIKTGIGFLDHMLCALAKHARWDLQVSAEGDLYVDDHHTSEDVALTLGAAFDKALGERVGIARFGYAYAPLDESLARVVVDISSRPCAQVQLALTREQIGSWSCENIVHFFESFAVAARVTLHVDVLRGVNDHHKVEAAFKAFAIALKGACTEGVSKGVPSTKGVLS
jgi:imidazoleglycerol phosphate dehydratase HisB